MTIKETMNYLVKDASYGNDEIIQVLGVVSKFKDGVFYDGDAALKCIGDFADYDGGGAVWYWSVYFESAWKYTTPLSSQGLLDYQDPTNRVSYKTLDEVVDAGVIPIPQWIIDKCYGKSGDEFFVEATVTP